MAKDAFPQGVIVFFRAAAPEGQMARSIHLNGRNVYIGRTSNFDIHDDDYVVVDAEGNFLGCYPRDYVSAIIPAETTGPGAKPNANNP